MKKLNLGCGEFKKEGYINVDISNQCEPDLVYDLNIIPYPFEDNLFDLIELDHLLEHLNEPFKVMAELNRILRKKGKLILRVPHFSRAMTHPQHKRGFDVTFPKYFEKGFRGWYTGIEFYCERLRFHWFSQKYLMKSILSPMTYNMLMIVGKIIDISANLFPYFCSRIWCFWVGGFYEIEFVFRKL